MSDLKSFQAVLEIEYQELQRLERLYPENNPYVLAPATALEFQFRTLEILTQLNARLGQLERESQV